MKNPLTIKLTETVIIKGCDFPDIIFEKGDVFYRLSKSLYPQYAKSPNPDIGDDCIPDLTYIKGKYEAIKID